MVNLLHICETMTLRWQTQDEIRVPIETLKKFAERNHFELKKKENKNGVKYKLFRRMIPVHFISDDEKQELEIKILDISDIHIGNPNFDEKAFRSVLKQAVENQIEAVFIAGDVFDGCVNTGDILEHYLEQIEYAFNIFKDYQLKYYVINGNHDYSFEQVGLVNPIKILAVRLQEIQIDFNYFDTYLMDFIIAGVVKRVMHVERQDFNKKKVFAIEKLKQFEKDLGLNIFYEGKEYPIRFFQAGHVHVSVQIYYSRKKIYISQSGSFLKTERFEDRANFITAKVKDKKVSIW